MECNQQAKRHTWAVGHGLAVAEPLGRVYMPSLLTHLAPSLGANWVRNFEIIFMNTFLRVRPAQPPCFLCIAVQSWHFISTWPQREYDSALLRGETLHSNYLTCYPNGLVIFILSYRGYVAVSSSTRPCSSLCGLMEPRPHVQRRLLFTIYPVCFLQFCLWSVPPKDVDEPHSHLSLKFQRN